MDFALETMLEAGVNEVVVNVHAHSAKMREHLSARPAGRPGIVISDESKLLLGSAGGFRQALPLLGKGPFYAMNADVFHVAPLRQLAERHDELRRTRGVVMTLVLVSGKTLDEQGGEYREIHGNDATGLIEGFGVKKNRTPFYSGTAIFEPEAFSHLPLGSPSEFVPEVLEPAIRAGKVGFLHSDALWLDLGSPELWYRAEHRIREALAAGALPERLIRFLKASDPGFGGRFELGKNRIRLDDVDHEIKDLRNP